MTILNWFLIFLLFLLNAEPIENILGFWFWFLILLFLLVVEPIENILEVSFLFVRWEWMVLVDDDTILGVSKMIELIGCYANDTGPVTIGEVYGRMISPIFNQNEGFQYPAGGAGKALNRKSVRKLVDLVDFEFRCFQSGSIEDLMFGRVLADLDMTLTRTSRLHQCRPQDYPANLLRHQDPVSFHKFEQSDPWETYNVWFRKSDEQLWKFIRGSGQ